MGRRGEAASYHLPPQVSGLPCVDRALAAVLRWPPRDTNRCEPQERPEPHGEARHRQPLRDARDGADRPRPHLASMLRFDDDATHYMSVAVRESVVNAIKHGNQHDEGKRVVVVLHDRIPPRSRSRCRTRARASTPSRVPDPLAEENLLKAYGRGIFFMRHVHGRGVLLVPAARRARSCACSRRRPDQPRPRACSRGPSATTLAA